MKFSRVILSGGKNLLSTTSEKIAVMETKTLDGSISKQLKSLEKKYVVSKKFDLLLGIDATLVGKAEKAVDSLFFNYVEAVDSTKSTN